MALWDTIIGLVKKDANKYIYAPIPKDHVKGAQTDGVSLEAGKHYFRLWLTEMYLKKEREWFKSWYPVVQTHMLFRIESRTERDDWMGLTNIIEARDEALKEISTGSEQADAAMKRTIFLVRTSPDLTRADRKRVADALKTEFDEAKSGFEAVPDFNSIIRRASRMDVDETLRHPEPSLADIFD